MKTRLALLLLALVGCIPEPSSQAYQVSEVQLLFAENTERWTYFYGEPQVIWLDERRLALSQGKSESPLALPEALLVEGQAFYREIGPALPRVAQTTRTFPGFQWVVRSQQAIQKAWAFDGGWADLGGPFDPNRIQQTTPRPGSPRLAALSEAENRVVLQEILNRRAGRPVVVYALEPPLPPQRFEPSPSQYRLAAIAVQYGLETELALMPPNPQPTPRILGQGAQSAYTALTPAAYLARDPNQLLSLWRLVAGLQVPPPPTPSVDFSQSRVVAFFWGQKPTGGYSLQLVSSQLVGDTLRVTLRLTSPPAGAIVTQALTSPFLLLEVPGRFNRVEFIDISGRLLASAGP